MTLASWLVAFLTVLAVYAAFGHQLASLPVPLRALVLSGLLVALMVNLVMPVVSVAAAAWLPTATARQHRAETGIGRSSPISYPSTGRRTSTALIAPHHG